MRISTSRVSCADLKAALVLALQLAEKGVDGLPIPGVKGCISGILKIIEQEEVSIRLTGPSDHDSQEAHSSQLREDNIETFNGIVNMIKRFREVTVERLSKERNIPENLKNDVEGLAKTLRDIPALYEERIGQRSRMRRWKDFFSASDHAKALNGLGEDLRNAIQEFQTASLVNLQLMEQNHEDARRADEAARRTDEDNRLIDKLPVERKAFYDAHRERQINVCEPDTRVSLLEDVAEWAKYTDPSHPRILWLNGRAGVGKSTIAKTLATRFDAERALGGSFMFSKPNGVVDGSKVFTTLASQLAHHLPEFRNYLAAAIRAKEASMTAQIARQFEDLLAIPRSQLQSPPVTVLILDALDECTPETLTPVLTAIMENITRFPFLCVVITSRPENPIREVLYRFTECIREVNISNIQASTDIETYLRRELRDAYTRLMGHAKHAWPADKDLVSLVEMADNLFIFAATAVRFIGDERAANPEHRLEMILCGQHVGQKHPFSSLDVMYREILRNALPEGEDDLHDRFQAVVGSLVFSAWPHSVKSLALLLAPKYGAPDIRHALRTLHSVLVVPEGNETWALQYSPLHFSFQAAACPNAGQ
ncbi:hypothetical protein D9619_012900 [Psilocybe cf. subviscida]|uniref:NACHT domain-containing protein n=1 Tax=Psilocybe cf. subviscida TaxID=2480587 RepID=A0A8H5BI86_9AGAR|nr:hypothetical protein D9619_012900 [Psilocybe cf. subviscida]